MRKVAAYCGTRNLYPHMLTAAKSLMMNSSIDKIYFLIQDDKFPFLLPECIECINISNQTYFPPTGKNYNTSWTYMCLIRAALSKILPQEEKVLSLDVDTIVDQNIDHLWDLPLDNKFFTGVLEPRKSTGSFYYTNIGVCLFNLKYLRETKKDDEIIYCLNHFQYNYPEQDCFNDKSQTRIYKLPCNYNFMSKIHKKPDTPIIIYHFAGEEGRYDNEYFKKYRQIPLSKVIEKWKENRNEIQL